MQGINQLKYAYDALNTDINKYNTEGPLGIAANQYQNQMDQYNAGMIGQQQQAQQYGNLANSAIGALNTGAQLYGAYQYNNPAAAQAGNGTPIGNYINQGNGGAVSQSNLTKMLS